MNSIKVDFIGEVENHGGKLVSAGGVIPAGDVVSRYCRWSWGLGMSKFLDFIQVSRSLQLHFTQLLQS